ncbi:PAS domain S-box protein [Aggregicoccus sp. 17bor-14]|uniref:sensor histidine kinase n=1 Tax=Myxococcaceae TaxID=31 RepID=UPI00129CBC8B|nr:MULTISPECIES: ATP-binding protein [Myxococcaceae]MBF5044790.1 PAS domain S-box protein [Simulacricoccus sp. 17bor-14]MRI90534.1 PAS domain S-box protein [Aggregicoccus sp. 17bor-14]
MTFSSELREIPGARWVSAAAAVVAVTVTGLALVGWALEVPGLYRWGPALPDMVPATCMRVLLLALALVLQLVPGGFRLQSRVAQATAAVAVVLGAMTLWEALTGEQLPLLLRAGNLQPEGGLAARPALSTALSVVLLGLALLLLEVPSWLGVRPSEVLTLANALLLTVVLNGYIHRVGSLDPRPSGGVPLAMALPTAVALFSLGLATLCARVGRRGVMAQLTSAKLGGFFARRLAPYVVFGPLVLGVLLAGLAAGTGLPLTLATVMLASLVSALGLLLLLLAARVLDRIDRTRQEVAEALQRSEVRFRGLLETAPDAIVTVDASGRILYANAQTERLFGFPRAELLGQDVSVLLSEVRRSAHRRERNAYFSSPLLRAQRGVMRLVGTRKDGREVPLEVSLSPVEEGSFTEVTAVLRDISRRLQADAERERLLSLEQQARAEAEAGQALLQTVLDEAPVGVLFVEPGEAPPLVNRALRELLGKPGRVGREQLVSRLRMPDGATLPVADMPFARALRGHSVRAEVYLLQPEGRPAVPVLVNAAPAREPRGRILGAVVTLQDISARWELERLQEEYVGLISHDLRNPLNNISVRLQNLRRVLEVRGREEEQDYARERLLLDGVLRSVDRMNGMVEELLDTTRLESGVELHKEPTELARFLADVMERTVLPEERSRLRLEVPRPVGPVSVDPARLERVVVNLLSNALKYCPPGTPVVVRLEREGGVAVVSVRDEGPGIPEDKAARLFEKYFRVRSVKGVEGLGLGLYISRLIVEAHGGHIWVDSHPGAGSTFGFSVPVGTGAAGEAAPRTHEEDSSELASAGPPG